MSFKTLALAFLNTAKDDVILSALPLLGNAATAVAADDSPANEAAQLAALQVNLLAAVPTLERELIQLVAGAVNQSVTALVANAKADVAVQASTIASAQVPVLTSVSVTAPAVAVAVPKGV